MTVVQGSQRQATTSFLKLVVAGKIREAYDRYVAADLKHHNAYFQGDRASLLEAMEEEQAKFPHKAMEIKHLIEEGDMVAVHSHLKTRPEHSGLAVVHIFRFEHGKIAELWDVAQAVAKDSPNKNGMF